MLEGETVPGRWGQSREKNWDNCNSIINEIYLKKNVIVMKYLIAMNIKLRVYWDTFSLMNIVIPMTFKNFSWGEPRWRRR